jgi:hypothetical protein
VLFGSSGGQLWKTEAPPAKRREELRNSRRCGAFMAGQGGWRVQSHLIKANQAIFHPLLVGRCCRAAVAFVFVGTDAQNLLVRNTQYMAEQPIVFGTNTGVLVLAAFSGITGLLEG